MQMKEMPPMTVLCLETQTTLKDMIPYVREVPKRLYREVQRLNLEVTGPNYWIYDQADGNPDTVFTLQIALPVAEAKGIPDGFFFRELKKFKCLTDKHLGEWNILAATYTKLMNATNENGHTCTGICREIYLHIDFNQPDHNITEVQVGLR